jgi:hypothetical protein
MVSIPLSYSGVLGPNLDPGADILRFFRDFPQSHEANDITVLKLGHNLTNPQIILSLDAIDSEELKASFHKPRMK